MSDDEDYEALRQRNIAERNEFLKDFLKEIKLDVEEINKLESARLSIIEKENKSPKKIERKRRSARSPNFIGSTRFEVKRKYNTRSKKKKLGKEEDNDEELNDDQDIIVSKKSSNIKVMFAWSRPLQRDLDLMRLEPSDDDNSSAVSDEEIFEPKKKKIKKMSRVVYDPSTIPSPNEVTETMLNNIAKKASGKKYDALNGTSCHQCRQKTRDTKTICRSGECIGVRGQFCGPCLLGRYGESAYEALKDPDWACPPCRGLCNCSICRTRNGQRPTGILAPLAKEEGYNSVKDYLQAKDFVDSDEEDEKEQQDSNEEQEQEEEEQDSNEDDNESEDDEESTDLDS